MFSPIMFFKPSASTTLTTGLAHYWKMTSSSVDDLGLTCTDYNMSYGTSYGKIGGGALFNGTSSYINIGETTDPIFSNPDGLNTRSISVWIYPTQSTATACIIGLRKSGEISLRNLDAGSSRVFCHMYAKIGTSYQTWFTNSVDINVWTHFVITLDMVNRICKTYVNGEYSRYTGSDTVQAGTLATGTSQQRIGASLLAKDFYKGYIDEVGMWNRILTQDEVRELYCSGVGNQNPFTP